MPSKKTLAALVLAALTAPQALAEQRHELTIVADFYPTMIRNFNPYLSTNLRTTTDFIYEPLVVFNPDARQQAGDASGGKLLPVRGSDAGNV